MTGNDTLRKENQALRNESEELKNKLQFAIIPLGLACVSQMSLGIAVTAAR